VIEKFKHKGPYFIEGAAGGAIMFPNVLKFASEHNVMTISQTVGIYDAQFSL
jgi:hypothetical protein